MNTKLRELQMVQYDILKELKRVCEKNGLTFYLACGSCLGAVRHKGFIPWDDDVDVFMPVEDFDRFVKLKNEFKSDYFLQTKETDPKYESVIGRIRKNGTTLIEKEEVGVECHHGIFLDVYPLFGYPDNEINAKKLIIESYIYRLLIAGRVPYNHGIIYKIIANIVLKLCSGKLREKTIKRIYCNLRKNNNSKYLATFYGLDVSLKKVILYNREWFGVPQYIMFEDEKMPVATQVEKYLTAKYGDFMKLPPEDKQSSYHEFEVLDLENSYEKYKGQFF